MAAATCQYETQDHSHVKTHSHNNVPLRPANTSKHFIIQNFRDNPEKLGEITKQNITTDDV